MKLECPKEKSHRLFKRESYDSRGRRVNIELVDEYGRFVGDPLDLYTGDVTYRYVCAECGSKAEEHQF